MNHNTTDTIFLTVIGLCIIFGFSLAYSLGQVNFYEIIAKGICK